MTAVAPAALRPSPRCLDLIKRFERCRLDAYLPTPRDRPTIGWGSTGPDINLGMTWTQTQADARFARDIEGFAAGVARALDGAATTQDEFDGLCALAYNIGVAALTASTLLKKHRLGDRLGAAAQFLRWNRQDGVVLPGLTRRRLAEQAMYLDS